MSDDLPNKKPEGQKTITKDKEGWVKYIFDLFDFGYYFKNSIVNENDPPNINEYLKEKKK